MPYTKKTIKRVAKKGVKRHAKKARMYRSVADKASCSVTATLAASNANALYSYDTFQLAQFSRAVGVAQNYQRFRITGIKLTWKPVFDTYALPAAAGYAKPNLYYVIDKSGSIPEAITLEGLKQAGARVRALDEKPVSVKWRPAVISENQAVIGAGATFASPGGYVTSPWLSTNQNATTNVAAFAPSSTNHLGIKFYIEQAGNGGAQVSTPFPTEVTVDFEFTKPMISNMIGNTQAIGLQFATIDLSPDGVEGGSDGITIPNMK